MNKTRLILMSTALAALTIVTGCNKDGSKAATQVAAKVNGAEISVHLINNVLTHANGVTAENAAQVKNQILNKLIDQQLAIEQAMDRKLDRSPNVMQAIEAAKRDILARAYLEQVAAAQPKPASDEIKAFYADHPELFSQRRLYSFQELAVPAKSTSSEEVKQLVESGKSMLEIANALKEKNIPFRANSSTSAAEQLPLELLPRFHAMKDGDTSVIEGPQAILITHLVASQSQPIDQANALPRIEQFIANKRSSEAIAKEMKTLRDSAKIEKLGEFAVAGLETPQAVPSAETTAATRLPSPEAAPSSPAAIDDPTIAKGVAGLK